MKKKKNIKENIDIYLAIPCDVDNKHYLSRLAHTIKNKLRMLKNIQHIRCPTASVTWYAQFSG